MIICIYCGRDIDEIGQDNMSCTNDPMCEDCARVDQQLDYENEMNMLIESEDNQDAK